MLRYIRPALTRQRDCLPLDDPDDGRYSPILISPMGATFLLQVNKHLVCAFLCAQGLRRPSYTGIARCAHGATTFLDDKLT